MKTYKLLFIVCISAITLYSCSKEKKTDAQLKEIAKSASANCPVKLTDDTRLDTVIAEPGRNLVYKYTITLLDSAAFNKHEFETERKGFIITSIQTSEEMKFLRTMDVNFNYEFYDTAHKLISKLRIEPKDYK